MFLLRELGITPAAMGVIFSLGAVGGLLGAIATPHIVRRIGEARAIPLSATAFSAVACLLPLAAAFPAIAFPLLVAQFFVASATVLLYNITQVTFRQRITPSRLLGRMNASIRFCVWGVMPLAALSPARSAPGSASCRRCGSAPSGSCCRPPFVVVGPFWSMRALPDAAALIRGASSPALVG